MIPRLVIKEGAYKSIAKMFGLDKEGVNLNNKIHRLAFKSSVIKLFKKEEKRVASYGFTLKTIELYRGLVHVVLKNKDFENDLKRKVAYKVNLAYFPYEKSIENKDCQTFLIGLGHLERVNQFSLKDETLAKLARWEKDKIK